MQNPTPPPPPLSPKIPEMPSTPAVIPPASPKIPEMPSTIPVIHDDPINPSSSSLFDWSDFLDFELDDTDALPLPYDAGVVADHIQHDNSSIPLFNNDHHIGHGPEPELEPVPARTQTQEDTGRPDTGRVRKRDPRLVCSNFLAGRVPCACPEVDEKLEEEMEMAMGNAGKKRARTGRAGAAAGSTARCQVPECEADISELKGYHKRHRVCLKCANATYVVLDGESKRYCQQCGKFHILSDFDEGKRSCRRKLERHNNRRRRKPADGKGTVEKEHEQIVLTEDVSCDDDTGKDASEREILVESEGQFSTLCSANGSQVIQSDSIVSYTASGEAPIEVEKENLKHGHSPSYFDNKSAFSSVCPTGRISFKLYDWNPAEFPRRLRHQVLKDYYYSLVFGGENEMFVSIKHSVVIHTRINFLQIFQWLASMPVELEGYIRPGCTIFTVFVSMPKSMWVKLFEEPAPCIHNFIVSPGNMLYGRGTLLVYLNNMIFRVIKDATSVMKVETKETAPKLHYVHPICFEAGKPMEFVACGSNLLQPKFRFLLSFDGKYLGYSHCVSSLCGKIEGGTKSVDHQVVKIYVPQTAPDLFGPAFVEVENESGLSNFIPILIGDKEICAEMKIMQQRLDASFSSKQPEFAASESSCEVSVLRHFRLTEFLLDVAWSLKEPILENMEIVASTQVQKFNHLTKFLIENESTAILERVLSGMKILVDSKLVTGVSEDDMRLFQNNMDIARRILSQRQPEKDLSLMLSRKSMPGGSSSSRSSCNNMLSAVPATCHGPEVREKRKVEARMDLTLLNESATVPLLDGEVFMSVNIKDWPGKSSSRFFTGSLLTNRPVITIIAAVAVCLGLCAVFLHPQQVELFATTIRRCLFENN